MTDTLMPERAWLVVVSAEHAGHAVEQQMIQINDGRRGNLTRLSRGDGIVLYSPTDRFRDKKPLRAFTALGLIADEQPYQAEPMNMGPRGVIAPWRRRIDYLDAHPLALSSVTDDLHLTQDRNWGYRMRFGLAPLPPEDFVHLHAAMTR
ncbi:EVE domain-containing protein [Streptomyces sp. NPDC050704]|uniref:EVE domain-containing protein n=1 Tax=Streptomyces sp. NPDC050704 TaxID=3157219 RepID=UPI0034372F63